MNLIYALILSFLLTGPLVPGAYASEGKPGFLVCKIDLDFPPFTTLDGTGIWQQKIIHAVKDLPAELKFHEAPRKRCLIEAEKNIETNAVMVGVTEERKKYLSYPMKSATEVDRESALGIVRFIVVIHKGAKVTWDGKKFGNLGAEPVGVQRGFQYEEELKKMGVKIEEITSSEQNLEKINLGRIPAAVMLKEQYEQFKAKNKLPNVIELPIPFSVTEIYLGVSTPYYLKNKKLVDAIWSNLKKNNHCSNKSCIDFNRSRDLSRLASGKLSASSIVAFMSSLSPKPF